MMQNLSVVLVRPKYARNVGMVARAMGNYNLKKLILIEPRCELNKDAQEGATHSQEILQNARIYPHWQRFYDWETEGVRIAFSARDGKRRESFDFSTTLGRDSILLDEILQKPTYLIFGPEDHGLADNDLDFVHRVFQMKLPGTHQSMNLSHAIVAALTILHQRTVSLSTEANAALEKESFFFPDQTLKRWLETLNIDISLHQKVNAYTVLKKLFLKGIPSSKELRMLETVLQQNIRKLKERQSPRYGKRLDAYLNNLDDTLPPDRNL